MTRVLIYGGCHALILRNMLQAACSDRLTCSLIINFALIASGKPFPYDTLRDFDVVIFSPIENKGEYNTKYLLEACQTLHVDAVSFPWMEWHGYCPGAVKGVFKGRFQWHYHGLIELAAAFSTFQSFHDFVIESFPDNETIDNTFERTTTLLAAAEDRHETTVRISDFILDRHRDSRLFLISDHPSQALYLHALSQILAAIGLGDELAVARLARETEEPQWQWRTPVFPNVARRLGLAFDGGTWVDDELLPGRACDLRTYLGLYYHRDSVILGPVDEALIFPIGEMAPRHEEKLGNATRLVANRLADIGTDDRHEYMLLESLCGESVPVAPGGCFGIHAEQWRSTWAF